MANIKRANTSGVTKSGVAIADVPDAPTIGTATAVDATSATVTYTAATTGGTGTTFTATSTPGSLTGTGSSPITVGGLSGLTSYTFTVRASNSTGNSPFSSASNSITTPAAIAFDSIATVLVGSGGSSTVTFSSIPSTYKHLQLRYIARATWQYGDSLLVRLNGDTTSGNYPYTHYLTGNGAAASSGADNSSPQPAIGYLMPGTGSYSQAGMFSTGVIDILDYKSTNKNKVMKNIMGSDNNYTGNAGLPSGLTSTVWLNTAAVSTITITAVNSTLAQHSHFALYGIKG